MRTLVTGAAGFIGSHLAERLAGDGHEVLAIDSLTSYYDATQTRANLQRLASRRGCEAIEADLRTCDLPALMDGVDTIFHQAGQPGVRDSWEEGFTSYVEQNVLVTKLLLEAARDFEVSRFVFASSSSVYGNAARYPTTEEDLPMPYSPYGVTKLAAEHLCGVYARNWGLPTVSLRYFTVYGPRQRPDMSMHRLIEAARRDRAFPLYGDGGQVRDFTYVDDVVEANLLAVSTAVPAGTVMNIAGGTVTRLLEVIDIVGELVGRPVRIDRRPAAHGDVRQTSGSTVRARGLLDWAPRVELREGLVRQVAWHEERGRVVVG